MKIEQRCFAIATNHENLPADHYLTKTLQDTRMGNRHANLTQDASKVRLFGTSEGAERTRRETKGHHYLALMRVVPIKVVIEQINDAETTETKG